METFAELKALFQVDVYVLLDEIFSKDYIQKEVITFNQDQLLDGTDATGKKINTIGGTPYRKSTISFRRRKGLPVDRVTLRVTGEFYETFEVKIVKNGYEITANFDKGTSASPFSEEDVSSNILDNFDPEFDFLGLDKGSLVELVNEWIYPELSRLIRAKFGFN